MARCSEQGLPWGLAPGEMPLKRCTLSFQIKFEGGGALRTKGGEMKLDPDLHMKKKVFPWDPKWCAFMQISVLSKNIGLISGYLSRGGLRGGNTWPYLSRELPGDLTMTKPPYCYVD